MFLAALPDAIAAIDWTALGLTPGIDLGTWGGFHPVIRWYSLSYIAGILIGWWYLTKLIDQPGAPMARRHADDLVFYATLGILIGGRLAYVLFYRPSLLREPVEVLKLWEGGMSFHGGLAGVILAIVWLARRNGLSILRVCDYVACATPFGLFFGRLANFVNGELWGRPSDLPWAVVFPRTQDGIPRHPSQLYEALLEGVVLFALLGFLFWRTRARYEPGRLFGIGLAGYGACRFLVELVREPDAGLENLWWGLSMGQTLSVPMILAGVWIAWTAPSRRQRIEPVAGSAGVA